MQTRVENFIAASRDGAKVDASNVVDAKLQND